jgi:hypothetical protein
MARRGAAFKNGYLLDFTMSVAGLDESARALFETSPRIRRRVRDAIERQARAVEQRASSVELRTMVGAGHGRRPGRLAAGMTHRIREREQTISALVWNRAPHFWMLSYGSPKNEVMVNPFWRRVKAHDVHGNTRFRSGKRRSRLKWGTKAFGVTNVSARGGGPFARKVNLRSHPFLASAWQAVRADAEADLVGSVQGAVAEVQAELAGVSGGEGI